MVTILKLHNNLISGSVQMSHGRKKHVRVGGMSSQRWLFFSIVRVLCTTNLLQEVRRSTKNITLKFWKDCVMPWEENDRVSSQAVTGIFTTIRHQRIHRTLCSIFSRNTRLWRRNKKWRSKESGSTKSRRFIVQTTGNLLWMIQDIIYFRKRTVPLEERLVI